MKVTRQGDGRFAVRHHHGSHSGNPVLALFDGREEAHGWMLYQSMLQWSADNAGPPEPLSSAAPILGLARPPDRSA